MRSALPALAAAATAGLLAAGAVLALPAEALTAEATTAAAGAASGLDGSAPSALLRGTLRVLADVDHTQQASLAQARSSAAAELGQHGHDDHSDQSDEGQPDDDAMDAYLQVGGVWVPVEQADVDGVSPGSSVTLRVEVPSAVVDAVQDGRAVDAVTDASTAATTTIPERALADAEDSPAATSSSLARASAVAAARTTEPVAADVVTATAPRATAVTSAQDVTVVAITMAGQSDSYYSDAGVDSLISSVNGYWNEQTGGVVGFRRDGPVTRYSSSLSCNDPNALWTEAARRAGFTGGAGEHLLLLLPPAAYAGGCSYGLGSVGASPGAGGVAYVSDASWPAIAHELGHNMSLLHANRLQCGSGVDEAVGTTASYRSCTVQDYGDRTDVMSSAAAKADGTPLGATGSASAFELARLGVLASGGRAAVTAPGTTTWTIKPLSGLSGLRSVLVTDPRSGDVYDLEVRAGTGRDAFGWGGSTRVTYGLRVLKTSSDGGSLVLDPTPTNGTDSNVVVAPGTTFTSAAGGVAIRTTANADGSVTAQVSLARGGQEHWTGSTSTPETTPTSVTRVQGDDRYGTATAVSRALVATPQSAQRVFVASGATFPDALAAGAAAGRTSSTTPVVLVPATGQLPGTVTTELSRLRASRITVVGGPAAVSDEVFAQLQGYAGTVDRVQGDDRYATSAAAATQVAGSSTGGPVFLATGRNYPDALSGAAAAASTGGSLLLTEPGALSPATAAALRQLSPSGVYVLGGGISPATIDAVAAVLPAADVEVLAGADRYETAALVSQVSFPEGAEAVVLATGQDFPDALAGGPLAAAKGAPLLLVQPGCAPGVVVDEISDLGATSATVLGGTRSLSDDAARLARC